MCPLKLTNQVNDQRFGDFVRYVKDCISITSSKIEEDEKGEKRTFNIKRDTQLDSYPKNCKQFCNDLNRLNGGKFEIYNAENKESKYCRFVYSNEIKKSDKVKLIIKVNNNDEEIDINQCSLKNNQITVLTGKNEEETFDINCVTIIEKSSDLVRRQVILGSNPGKDEEKYISSALSQIGINKSLHCFFFRNLHQGGCLYPERNLLENYLFKRDMMSENMPVLKFKAPTIKLAFCVQKDQLKMLRVVEMKFEFYDRDDINKYQAPKSIYMTLSVDISLSPDVLEEERLINPQFLYLGTNSEDAMDVAKQSYPFEKIPQDFEEMPQSVGDFMRNSAVKLLSFFPLLQSNDSSKEKYDSLLSLTNEFISTNKGLDEILKKRMQAEVDLGIDVIDGHTGDVSHNTEYQESMNQPFQGSSHNNLGEEILCVLEEKKVDFSVGVINSSVSRRDSGFPPSPGVSSQNDTEEEVLDSSSNIGSSVDEGISEKSDNDVAENFEYLDDVGKKENVRGAVASSQAFFVIEEGEEKLLRQSNENKDSNIQSFTKDSLQNDQEKERYPVGVGYDQEKNVNPEYCAYSLKQRNTNYIGIGIGVLLTLCAVVIALIQKFLFHFRAKNLDGIVTYASVGVLSFVGLVLIGTFVYLSRNVEAKDMRPRQSINVCKVEQDVVASNLIEL